MRSADHRLAPELLAPPHLHERAEVLVRPSPVPAAPGVYAWYFDVAPGRVPCREAHEWQRHRLLYVGIAPRQPAANGGPTRRTLRHRIREHYRGNAYGSTLRLTLGCLLGLELRRIASRKRPGTAKRMTFGRDGERQLDTWMEEHARVVWLACADAWHLERELLSRLAPPLNLDANAGSTFRAELRAVRDEARARARALPPLEQ